jgi:3-phenylpropionate/trans-cinnamate dioxygenase ferredoxin subunit
MADWVRVAAVDDCPPGSLKGFVPNDVAIVLANVDGDLYALEDRCSHDDGPLAEGEWSPVDCTVECPRHGSLFDLRTGKPRTLPAFQPVRTFPVEVIDDNITLEV